MAGESRSFGRSAGMSLRRRRGGVLTTSTSPSRRTTSTRRLRRGRRALVGCELRMIAVLHRPVEQLISRGIAERRAAGAKPAGDVLRGAAAIQAGIAAASPSWRWRCAGRSRTLLSGQRDHVLDLRRSRARLRRSFFARGYLAGDDRFGLLAALLVSESVSRRRSRSRCGRDRGVPRRGRRRDLPPRRCSRSWSSRRPAPAKPTRSAGAGVPATGPARGVAGGAFAAAVFVVMLSEQVFLNGGRCCCARSRVPPRRGSSSTS